MRIGLARRRAAKELRGVWARLQGRTSLADRTGYRDACREAVADEEAFSRFRRDPRYAGVVETASFEHGAAYLQLALERAPELAELLDAFRDNDVLGSPQRANYGPHGEFSPTTLRYVKVLADLRMLFGPLDGFDIIEIGGGFGGQALVCSRSAQLSSYTLVDLQEAAALQRSYLGRLNVEISTAVTQDALHGRRYTTSSPDDLAYSELTRPIPAYLERRAPTLETWIPQPQLPLAACIPNAQDAGSLNGLAGSHVLPLDRETADERKGKVDILVWGASLSQVAERGCSSPARVAAAGSVRSVRPWILTERLLQRHRRGPYRERQ